MAPELAASLVVAPLLSLLKDMVSSSLLGQYKVMAGMEKDHDNLKRLLPPIEVIANVEKQVVSRRGGEIWLQDLRAAAYKAKEVFDDFEYEALRRRAKENGHVTKLGVMARVKLFPTHNRVAFRIRMSSRLRSIIDTFNVLVDQMKTFGFHKLEPEAAPAQWKWREMDSVLVDTENKIVVRSREGETKRIVEILLNHQASSSGDLLVVPIIGMGGLGKTTLAQLIYNDPQVKEHFQLLKWVCVSEDFNVCNLANKICGAKEETQEEALKKLQEYLRGNRYLLVLDDVWNEKDDVWEKLKACLKQGAAGSAVLTTTRIKKIAEFMGTVANSSWKNNYHDVEILDRKFIREIIEARAFQGTEPEELVKLVDPIAKRCAGSPMAAKALGSVLRNKTTKEEWEEVLRRSMCSDETGILPILKLSYNDLPSNMKQCFAFCAIYPKDYEIDVDELIQLWMANGYISDQNKVPAETMGKQIVNEMVSRSFFQYEDSKMWIGYSYTTIVKIHDLMHDVALSASEKECVCITNDSDELIDPSAVRHILFETIDKKRFNSLFGTVKEKFSPIQTMIFIGRSFYPEDVPHPSRFSSLRALSMPQSGVSMSIKPKHLCHLRYLDLSNNYAIEALPDDISILYSLQTLKLSNCISLKRLPEQMKHMTALRHLNTSGCTKLECMPPEIGRLTSLRTITCFVVGQSGSNCSSIAELKDLNIGGSLMLKQLENVTGRRNTAKAANLENKKELIQLSLEWTSGKEEEQQCHEVLESLKVHDGLRALQISSYQGTRFPSWMGMLKNIVQLQLFNCSKAEQLPELLEQLAELQTLHLEGLGKLQFLCSRCSSSTFGKLKELTLYTLDVFDGFWEAPHGGGVVAFPKLEILCIGHCKSLAALPEASVLREPYGGGDCSTVARSAFPELKVLGLEDLCSFERWEIAALEIEEEDAALFPSLETVVIRKCPKLTTLPRAPKVKQLELKREEEEGQIPLGGMRRMTSLSGLRLFGVKLDGKEEGWDHLSSLEYISLDRCSLCFQARALSLWVCCGKQLQDLTISSCDQLEYWPEKAFQSLISLRRLWIRYCNKLIGYAAAAESGGPDQQQQATSSGRTKSQVLPHLEFLLIYSCESLVEVFNSSPALKTMIVMRCGKLECLYGKQQLLNQQEEASNSSTHDDATASTTPAVEEKKLSTRSVAPDIFLPSSLESLEICSCDGLSEVASLPSSLREINIESCSKVRLVSGQLDALEYLRIINCPELRSLESLCTIDLSALKQLDLYICRSLTSLPASVGPEPEEYSSLRRLRICGCPGIKSLPSALQRLVDSRQVLDYMDLDSRHQGRSARLLGRLCSSSLH